MSWPRSSHSITQRLVGVQIGILTLLTMCRVPRDTDLHGAPPRLYVRLACGRNLPDTAGIKHCNPYCKLRVGEHRFQSQVCLNSLDPEWQEDFDFTANRGDEITITVGTGTAFCLPFRFAAFRRGPSRDRHVTSLLSRCSTGTSSKWTGSLGSSGCQLSSC